MVPTFVSFAAAATRCAPGTPKPSTADSIARRCAFHQAHKLLRSHSLPHLATQGTHKWDSERFFFARLSRSQPTDKPRVTARPSARFGKRLPTARSQFYSSRL